MKKNSLKKESYEEENLNTESEDTLKGMFLSFQIAEEDYGIEIRYITEIVGIQKITEIPDMPHYVKGVVNLRGKVIPVVDLRLRFDMQEREYDERTCLIIINNENTEIALIVDTVNEVISIQDENISPPPKLILEKNHSESDYIHGIGKINNNVKILLDVNKLLFLNIAV